MTLGGGTVIWDSNKVPMLTPQHRQARLAFARKYETNRGTVEVWITLKLLDHALTASSTPKIMAFDPKYTKERKTLKYGDGNIKISVCFSGYGVGHIRLIQDSRYGPIPIQTEALKNEFTLNLLALR